MFPFRLLDLVQESRQLEHSAHVNAEALACIIDVDGASLGSRTKAVDVILVFKWCITWGTATGSFWRQ